MSFLPSVAACIQGISTMIATRIAPLCCKILFANKGGRRILECKHVVVC